MSGKAMVRNRDPFANALAAISHRLTTGVYGEGDPIVILDEAKRLGLSTTPVREALAWLCGAGLVDRAPVGGYRAPRLDAALLKDWYGFRSDCLSIGLRAIDRTPIPSHPTDDMDAVFDWIVDRADNVALSDAFRRTGLLLQRVREAEHRLLGSADGARAALVEAIAGRRFDTLSAHIRDYYAIRLDSAAALAFEANLAKARTEK
jgi:DNA-binding FadR family transcriptional regulator